MYEKIHKKQQRVMGPWVAQLSPGYGSTESWLWRYAV